MTEKRVDEVGYDAFHLEPHERNVVQMTERRFSRLENPTKAEPYALIERRPSQESKDSRHERESDEETPRKPFCACFVKIFRVLGSVVPYGGLLSSCFNLASTTLGAGIISLPSAFNLSGIVMSIVYLVLVTMGSIFSMNLLGKVILKTGFRTYEEAAEKLLGRAAGYGLAALMILLCFGGSVAYIIATGTLLTPVLASPGTPEYLKTKSGLRVITSMVWICCMLPLVIPKEINSLRYFSTIGVFCICYFVICIIVHSAQSLEKNGVPQGLVYAKTGNDALNGLSLFMFSFMCQINVFEIFAEMSRRTVFHLTLYSAISMITCALLYLLAGVFGYLDFGKRVTDSVLTLYDPVHEPMIAVGYVGIVIKLCVGFALHLIPLRDAVYHCFQWDVTTTPYWKHSIITGTPAFLALLCGLFIPKVNTVLGLLGAFCGGTIGFILPALFHMYSGGFSMQKVGWVDYLTTYLLLIGGVVAVVFGTGSTIYGTVTAPF